MIPTEAPMQTRAESRSSPSLATNTAVPYLSGMEFELDDEKAGWLENERGLTLHDIASVFADPNRLDWQDTRHDYGEERRKTIGLVETLVITAVYTMRGDVCRIITAWPANRKERRDYATP